MLALEKAEVSTRKREMAAEILLEEAMSSEESCVEEDESGKTKVVAYKVKRLSWESEKLKKIKQGLDKASKEGQTKRARDRALPRVEHKKNQQDCLLKVSLSGQYPKNNFNFQRT